MDYRKYNCYRYEYGWKVVSTSSDGSDERLVMCYVHEMDAKGEVYRLNNNEPLRYALAIEHEKDFFKKQDFHSNPYYSITGYYGD